MSQPSSATLVVLFKRPGINQGKQRLAAELGAEPACRIAEGLLACALADARQWPGTVVLAPAHATDTEWAAGLVDGAEVLSQGTGNLGSRLNTLDQTLRRKGHNTILYIGSDAPTLDQAMLSGAAAALERSDVVLCPAEDGGVTLMGNRKPWPDLQSLPWSTARLADALLRSCMDHGLTAASLPHSFDVDRPADLVRLLNQLNNDARSERQQLKKIIKEQTR